MASESMSPDVHGLVDATVSRRPSLPSSDVEATQEIGGSTNASDSTTTPPALQEVPENGTAATSLAETSSLSSSSARSSDRCSSEGWGGGRESLLQGALEVILDPARLEALSSCDNVMSYNSYNFFSRAFSIRGRNICMILAPLICLFLWSVMWSLLFLESTWYFDEIVSRHLTAVQHFIIEECKDDLITPLVNFISFLLAFRLARSIVSCVVCLQWLEVLKNLTYFWLHDVIKKNFWEARAAMGTLIATSRSNIADVTVGLMSPFRRTRRKLGSLEDVGNEQEAMELLCEYSKWLSAFPIATRHYLRPESFANENYSKVYAKQRYEYGRLVSSGDAQQMILECENTFGEASKVGIRVRDPPLVALNRLHQLAWDIAYFEYEGVPKAPTPHAQSILFSRITDQINVLCGSYGTMERISLTPLPMLYVVHLRSMTLLYLVLQNLSSVAKHGWTSLLLLLLLNWALLGVEACAVECEKPFGISRNHLLLGKMGKIVATNIGQALKELTMVSSSTKHGRN
ncbi:hypothetical protein THAOC_19789 [Thalassiosira oceanica]|uniref:Uncharacterized protein n=1 Tax=Thalassiosira oceanica TaxID=159749 RepID=K0S3T6_THAOC|nr:hypothetical protein THAOC_19789 [Thalassiosira oceanica]|eukprot:EJK59935.1 hypothetical protein THAOC_19789 [Thalassiosira oceanica]